ncbi:MAG: cellulase family glycosylhydrolase [Kiritimatiellae bacterium]|nr:cellulase family glycosylhydrolase [Kiritimatiellia bacterium]
MTRTMFAMFAIVSAAALSVRADDASPAALNNFSAPFPTTYEDADAARASAPVRPPEKAAPAVSAAAAAAPADATGWRPSERWRGFNLLGLFKKRIPAEAGFTDPKWERTPGYFHEDDFKWMKEWGFNFARLPMDYRVWIKDGDWNAIDPAAFKPIDDAVIFARAYGIHIQMCFHRAPGFCINTPPKEPADLFTDETALAVMIKHWQFFAKRYRNVPNRYLSFDPVNEPCFHPEKTIAAALSKVVAAIREIDPERFIMINGWDCGTRPIEIFTRMPGVGQSMRGYSPHGVSHYKAEWWKTPPSAEPVWPPKGWRSGREWLLKNVFDKWQPTMDRGGFVMSNEFGCYRHTPHPVALAFLEDYLRIWKEKNMGWALWNLRGTFGIIDSRRADVEYEDFHGHKLDRKMLELLRRY